MQVTCEIHRLALQGVSPREIAAELGCSRATVYERLRYLRALGHDIPLFRGSGRKPGGMVYVMVDRSVLAALRGPADRRDVTARKLAADLLRCVIAGDLVDAVLDDGEDL